MSFDHMNKSMFMEIVPKFGELYDIDNPSLVLCKPKVMPIKSITLEKMEKMQEQAINTVKLSQKKTTSAEAVKN